MTLFTGTIPTIASGDNATVATNLATYRDALKGLSEAWTAYTPTWTGSGSNPALGNGSFSGTAYARINKLIHFRIVLTMGTTTTYGTGQWRLTLPVAPVSSARVPFDAELVDTGAGGCFGRAMWDSAVSALALCCDPTTAGNYYRAVGPTIPWTWGSTDLLVITGTYESA